MRLSKPLAATPRRGNPVRARSTETACADALASSQGPLAGCRPDQGSRHVSGLQLLLVRQSLPAAPPAAVAALSSLPLSIPSVGPHQGSYASSARSRQGSLLSNRSRAEINPTTR